MPKGLLQDMVKVKTLKTSRNKSVLIEPKEERRRPEPKIERQRNGRTPKYRIYILAIISVVFLLFALSLLFSKAKITLIPRTLTIDIKDDITASKDISTDSLPFDLVVLNGEEEKIIQGGEMKDVSESAKGSVIIYNSFSSANQALAIDTRLEGSNGKIYKTTKKVVVPGILSDGKPGSVEVSIYAGEAGASYDSGPIDFSLVGFKGTPKYAKIYARSKGNITGGFQGKSLVVSDLEKTSALSEIKSKLEVKLSSKIKEQIPSGFVLFDDAVVLDIKDNNIVYTPNDDGTVTVKVNGTIYGFLFSVEKLTQKLAQDSIENYDDSIVYVQNFKDLVFTLKDKNSITLPSVKSISFNITGSPNFVWQINTEMLAQEIFGKSKKEFNSILESYSNIASTNLMLRPFWKKSFPENPRDIEIIVNYPSK